MQKLFFSFHISSDLNADLKNYLSNSVFKISRPVPTSKSHNKKASTYWSKQRNKPKNSSEKQTTLTNLFETSLP